MVTDLGDGYGYVWGLNVSNIPYSGGANDAGDVL